MRRSRCILSGGYVEGLKAVCYDLDCLEPGSLVLAPVLYPCEV